jgi:hypothetical protein
MNLGTYKVIYVYLHIIFVYVNLHRLVKICPQFKDETLSENILDKYYDAKTYKWKDS